MTIPFSKLLKTAKKSPHYKNQHSTLVFKGGSLVASGFNHDDVHSEVNALNKLWPSKRVGTTIVNLMLKTKSRNFGNSKPCIECQEFLVHNKVSKVVWFNGLSFEEERL